jgi:hypothetical protein
MQNRGTFPPGESVSEMVPDAERAHGSWDFQRGHLRWVPSGFAVIVVARIALRGVAWAFVVTGALGFVCIACVAAFYRLPQ